MTRNTDHEVHEHDRGLGYDLRTMVSRRRALFFLGAAAGTTALAACSSDPSSSAATSSSNSTSATAASDGTTCVAATPQETAGPYPGDGSNGPNVLIESGIVRQDITSSFNSYSGTADGVPTTIQLTLQDLASDCGPGAGMAVYLWHCNRDGKYSMYDVADQNYLRGVQVADASGIVTFSSIFPACYSGRWPHIHFEVFDSLESAVAGDNARLTSQIAVPQDACTTVFDYDDGYAKSISNLSQSSMASDNVFGDGWDAELATATGTPQSGMKLAITIGVAEKSQNTAAPSAGGSGGGTPPANGSGGGTPPAGGPGGGR